MDVGVHPAKKSVWSQLPLETDQIWAEGYLYWTMGEPLYLPKEIEELAKDQQEKHRESSGKEGTVKLGFTGPAEAEDVPEWEYEVTGRYGTGTQGKGLRGRNMGGVLWERTEIYETVGQHGDQQYPVVPERMGTD